MSSISENRGQDIGPFVSKHERFPAWALPATAARTKCKKMFGVPARISKYATQTVENRPVNYVDNGGKCA
jgi:hypothetical protein